MKSHPFRHLTLLTLLVAPHSVPAKEIEIDAGNFARPHSIVVIPDKFGKESGSLKSNNSDAAVPFQRSDDGNLVFISPPLAAGQKLTLGKQSPVDGIPEQVKAEEKENQVLFTLAGKNVVTYQTTARESPRANLDPKFLRGGYLHPLFTPSGKIVTDDYALNHLHHHGIWTAWTKTSFDGREPDFWNMGQGKGKVDFVSLGKTWSGPVEAGLVSNHKFTDLTGGSPIDVLNETWTVKTYAIGPDYNLIDLESRQTTIGDKPLLLPVYHYGGIGIRGLEAWNGKDAASFTTSENSTDRVTANGQPARWITMTGKAGEGSAGLAILAHPENFRSPQPVRIHPNEPFISFAPQTNEAMAIRPGETYRMRYRFVVFDGDADAKLLESLWQDYATPVTAKWID